MKEEIKWYLELDSNNGEYDFPVQTPNGDYWEIRIRLEGKGWCFIPFSNHSEYSKRKVFIKIGFVIKDWILKSGSAVPKTKAFEMDRRKQEDFPWISNRLKSKQKGPIEGKLYHIGVAQISVGKFKEKYSWFDCQALDQIWAYLSAFCKLRKFSFKGKSEFGIANGKSQVIPSSCL